MNTPTFDKIIERAWETYKQSGGVMNEVEVTPEEYEALRREILELRLAEPDSLNIIGGDPPILGMKIRLKGASK